MRIKSYSLPALLVALSLPTLARPDSPPTIHRGVAIFGSAAGGNKLSEVKLDAPPVWDGMAATTGRLFISTMDGKVVCLGKRR